uniref:SDR family oxidoreductase n=1 Tax=Dendroctonus ponderosae TaxID=77166 RepID=A0AAR5P510_DENPD
IAELLVKNGAIVAGIARRVEHVRQHAQELAGEKESLHGYQCDLTKKDEILAAFKKITAELGPISILINNAGTIKMTGIIEGDIEKWQAVVDTNLLAAAICIREAVASMKANSIKGHLININSTAGHIVPDYPKFGFYPSTKFGLRALTETPVSPGYVETDIVAVAFGEFAKEETWSAITAKGLDVIDIANAVLYVLNTPEHVNVTELTVVRQGSAV